MSRVGLGKARTLRFDRVGARRRRARAVRRLGGRRRDVSTKTRSSSFTGSKAPAAQFESQKMRFMSNGYPAGWFDEVDYNSTRAVGDKSEVDQQIDDAIAALKQRTGKSQVDVVAHSLGTSVMYDYLTERGHGRPAQGERRPLHKRRRPEPESRRADACRMGGQGHARPQHGRRAERHDPQPDARPDLHLDGVVRRVLQVPDRSPAGTRHQPAERAIQIAGKALNFPENSGASGATVQIWPLNDNGQRTSTSPVASIAITDGSTGGGAWGPVTVQAGKRYEFALVRPALPTLHIYYEPFVRSDYTLRLLQSVAIEAVCRQPPRQRGRGEHQVQGAVG